MTDKGVNPAAEVAKEVVPRPAFFYVAEALKLVPERRVASENSD